jgi:hypothetical protein
LKPLLPPASPILAYFHNARGYIVGNTLLFDKKVTRGLRSRLSNMRNHGEGLEKIPFTFKGTNMLQGYATSVDGKKKKKKKKKK